MVVRGLFFLFVVFFSCSFLWMGLCEIFLCGVEEALSEFVRDEWNFELMCKELMKFWMNLYSCYK